MKWRWLSEWHYIVFYFGTLSNTLPPSTILIKYSPLFSHFVNYYYRACVKGCPSCGSPLWNSGIPGIVEIMDRDVAVWLPLCGNPEFWKLSELWEDMTYRCVASSWEFKELWEQIIYRCIVSSCGIPEF